jgi:hypothetical protein
MSVDNLAVEGAEAARKSKKERLLNRYPKQQTNSQVEQI